MLLHMPAVTLNVTALIMRWQLKIRTCLMLLHMPALILNVTALIMRWQVKSLWFKTKITRRQSLTFGHQVLASSRWMTLLKTVNQAFLRIRSQKLQRHSRTTTQSMAAELVIVEIEMSEMATVGGTSGTRPPETGTKATAMAEVMIVTADKNDLESMTHAETMVLAVTGATMSHAAILNHDVTGVMIVVIVVTMTMIVVTMVHAGTTIHEEIVIGTVIEMAIGVVTIAHAVEAIEDGESSGVICS
jgi:hypothetical protein